MSLFEQSAVIQDSSSDNEAEIAEITKDNSFSAMISYGTILVQKTSAVSSVVKKCVIDKSSLLVASSISEKISTFFNSDFVLFFEAVTDVAICRFWLPILLLSVTLLFVIFWVRTSPPSVVNCSERL